MYITHNIAMYAHAYNYIRRKRACLSGLLAYKCCACSRAKRKEREYEQKLIVESRMKLLNLSSVAYCVVLIALGGSSLVSSSGLGR